jgi:hypothetical protein
VITKKSVAVVVGVAALAAWLAAAATSGVRPVRAVATPPAQIDLRGAALTAEIERLHERLKPTVSPEHGRNLFQFAQTRSAVAPPAAPAAVIGVAPFAPAPQVEPPFKLIGIAEDNGARTAILSSPTQLLMVREGDNAGTYRVATISVDTVELRSTSDDSVLRLALK